MDPDVSSECPEGEFQPVETFRAEALWEFGGADVVGNMLGLGPHSDLTEADADHVQTLHDIIQVLTDLCGTQEDAIRWLLRSPGFSAVAGNDPYHCLEWGSFWTMATMLDWLKIIAIYRPTELMKNLFRPDLPDYQINPTPA